MSVGYGKWFVCLLGHGFFCLLRSCSKEHVDLQAVAQRGIQLGYTPDVLTDAGTISSSSDRSISRIFLIVADLSVMLALMAGRNGGETMSIVVNSQECVIVPI